MAKICVTIGRGRHSSMIEEWKAAADAGAGLVELRLDCLRRDPDLKKLLENRFTPVIVTVRRTAEGGLWRGDEEKRLRLVREAIVAGVDYIDLEHDIANAVPRFGKTQRIISYHNFKTIPDDLPEMGKELAARNADIVKIAGLSHSIAASMRVLEFVKGSDVPAIGLAMGPLGVFTRVLGAKFGSPFTYASFSAERTYAPGMLTLAELRDDYLYDQIDAETELYAVIGDPIGHSLSPAVHNPSFRAAGVNKVMVPIQVPAGQVKDSFATMGMLNLRGVSVTIPHKEGVFPVLSGSDKTVEMIGACNTMVRDAQDRWVGHNTDARAAADSIEAVVKVAHPDTATPLMDKQVLVLGAGGVARAIAFALARRSAIVTIVNRTPERAQELAEEVGCRTTPWEMRANTPYDILVNATSVGMHPEVDDSPMPSGGFRAGTLVFDTVYHPENTLFIKQAQEHECQTITGVDMFVRQAALQFELYTGGKRAPIDLMRRCVKKKFSPVAL
jgi:3-dehydroquinate dehydratase/shikimate dehydrogenase